VYWLRDWLPSVDVENGLKTLALTIRCLFPNSQTMWIEVFQVDISLDLYFLGTFFWIVEIIVKYFPLNLMKTWWNREWHGKPHTLDKCITLQNFEQLR